MNNNWSRVEIIVGPMFCGKSDMLIRRAKNAEIAKKQFIAFKPSSDTRFVKKDQIISRTGGKIPAQIINVSGIYQILDLSEKYDLVIIDEIHLWPMELINLVSKLLGRKKRILLAGLDKNFRGEPFTISGILMAMAAPEIIYLKSICNVCKNEDAIWTQKLTAEGKPAPYDSPTIEVGGFEAGDRYEPRCTRCFVRPIKIVKFNN